MIEVVSFSKIYGSRGGEHAVRDLSFTVAPSDILGLVGPNGAGKTTTLRALAGILRPTSGQIRIGGFDVVKEPVRAKRLLALVPDTPNPYEMLTVREHLEFARLAYAVDDGRDPEELLARFELDGKRDELCGSLSRGMRQKLAICCALLHRPMALLLDEPLTGLDPHGTRVMRDAIASAAAEGAAIVVSSHQLELVERVCTRVLLVKKGQKVVEGTLDEIRASAALGASATLEEVFFRLVDDDPLGATGGGAVDAADDAASPGDRGAR